MLKRQTHQGIVTCTIIRNGHHGRWTRIMLLDNRRNIANQHTTHRPIQGTVRSITFAFLAYRREDMTAKDAAAVLNKVPRPDMTHLAVHILQVLMGHRDPFRFTRRTRCGSIHIRFTRKQHILFAVLMTLHIRTQGLKTIVYRHIQAIQTEQILRRRST